MNEKVIPEMALMPKEVKGKYTVQLFDAETNELIQEVENHNMVNPFLSTLMYQGLYGSPMLVGATGFYSNTDKVLSESNYKGVADVMTLFESAAEPQNSLEMFPLDFKMKGWCDLRSSGKSDNNIRGNVNINESYTKLAVTEEGSPVIRKHLVIDFLTNQANGTFNNISIGPDLVNTFTRQYLPSGNSDYSNYSFDTYPKFLINSSNWAPEGVTMDEKKSIYGPISIESDHIFWICGAYNANQVTFFKFDISDGNIKCTQTIQTSGAPEEITSLAVVGVRCKGKFYLFTEKNSLKNYMYKFSESGSYEGRVEIKNDINQSSLWAQGSLLALPNCIMQCNASGYNNDYGFRIIDTDGSILFAKNKGEFTKYFNSLAGTTISYLNSLRLVPYVLPNNKIIAVIFGDNHPRYGYLTYDPTTNKIEKAPYGIFWTKYGAVDSNNIGETFGIFKNLLISISGDGFEIKVAMPWWSWSKLPTPITKTSSTTMKIQYDVEIPIMLPGTKQLFNKK